MSINISDDMVKKMNKFPKIQWESFMSKLLSEYLDNLVKTDKLVVNSEFTSEDAEKFGELVKETAWESFKDEFEIKH